MLSTSENSDSNISMWSYRGSLCFIIQVCCVHSNKKHSFQNFTAYPAIRGKIFDCVLDVVIQCKLINIWHVVSPEPFPLSSCPQPTRPPCSKLSCRRAIEYRDVNKVKQYPDFFAFAVCFEREKIRVFMQSEDFVFHLSVVSDLHLLYIW